MKNTLFICLLILLLGVLLLSACGINTDTDTETSTESNTETEFESDSQTETESDTETETAVASNTESNTETSTQTDTETEANTETEVDSDTDTETSTESDTETEFESDSQTETESDTETETAVASNTESNTETSTQTDTETEANTETEVDSDTKTDTSTEEVDTSTDTESDTATEVIDSSTDTETDTETEVDTSTETEIDTEVDTSTEAEQNIVKKYYKEFESGYRNYPEEDIVDDGIDEGIGLTKDYLDDPIFLDSGFELKQESQYKIIDSFDELEPFTLLNHDEIDPNIFDNNYIVVILHHFMGPSFGADYTMGFYDGSFESNGEATITYDEFSVFGKIVASDYRDVYRLHFIAVPKNEIEYTDEICKISLNKNIIEQYYLQAYNVDTKTEETNAYFFTSIEEAKNELEFFPDRIDFETPFIVIHLSEGIETDYIVNGFKYENGEIFITVEIYNKNESFYLDGQYEFGANLILASLRPYKAELEITVPDNIPSDCKVNVIFKNIVSFNDTATDTETEVDTSTETEVDTETDTATDTEVDTETDTNEELVDTSTDTAIDTEVSNDEKTIISYDTLTVTQKNEHFIVKLIGIDKEITFDSQRNVVKNDGVELQDITNIYSFLMKKYDKITMTFGKMHLDFEYEESDFYKYSHPSYITSDAYLVSLGVNERDDVYEVAKIDLLTGELADSTICEIQYWDTVERLYQKFDSFSTFSKLKINKIYDGLYTGGKYSDDVYSGVSCVLIECTVVEDFYNLFSKDDVITIPVYLSSFYDEEDLRAFVSSCDCLFVYGNTFCDPIKNYEDKREIEITNLVGVSSLDNYSIIPIIDGKVDLDALHNLLDQLVYLNHTQIEHFDQIIVNGMDEEELAEKIRQAVQEIFLKFDR